jgi:hypothetical protein
VVYSLDFETELITPALQAPQPICLAYSLGSSEYIRHWSEAADDIERLLTGDEPIAIANAAFDTSVIMAWWPELTPLVFDAYRDGRIKDVLIRQRLMDLAIGRYRPRYSLEALVYEYYKVRLDKEGSPRLDYGRLRDVPIDQWAQEYIDYPLSDAKWHRQVYEAQNYVLEADDAMCVLDDQDRQTRADFALRLASVWGIRTDEAGIDALEERCQKIVDEIRPELLAAGILKRNKDGTYTKKQAPVKRLMLDAAGGDWNKVKLTKKGCKLQAAGEDWQSLKYVSIDKEACKYSESSILQNYSEYSAKASMLTGQIKHLREGVVTPLHTRFNVLMDTGRTSSSKPNIQNVRKEPGARECFVPRPGHVFIGCDYGKAELHTLAQCCIDLFGRSHLADRLNAGYDPHTGLGATRAGLDYDEAVRLIEVGDKQMKMFRSWAKPANFGLPGGMGVEGLRRYAKSSYGIVLTYEQAEAMKAAWQAEYPEVAYDYLGFVRSLLDGDYATVRHFFSNRWRAKTPYCAAANSFFQGRAADGAKLALFAVAELEYNVPSSALYGAKTVDFIHDELLVEALEDRASDAAWELRDVMVREFNKVVPDVPVSADPVLMDRWSKEARQIVDSEGNLQVWRYEGGV